MKMILGDIACLPVPGYRARNFSITGWKVYDTPPGFQDDFVTLRPTPSWNTNSPASVDTPESFFGLGTESSCLRAGPSLYSAQLEWQHTR